MLDAHIHLERGPYTLDWVQRFVQQAQHMGMQEIWLLEHCYRFKEFVPMYGGILGRSEYIDNWFDKKAGTLQLADYLALVAAARAQRWPVRLRFGLEVCYFEDGEDLIRRHTRDAGLDFLVGSVHFIDDFAFDHTAALWQGVDVDAAFKRYFEIALSLANSGLFDGMAHPDSLRLFGHAPSFDLRPQYTALANALAKNRMYAEMNSGTHRRCPDTSPLAMDEALLRAMLAAGVPICTASDAHCPEDVGEGVAALCRRIAAM